MKKLIIGVTVGVALALLWWCSQKIYTQLDLLKAIGDNFNIPVEGCLTHLDLNKDGIINIFDLATAGLMTDEEQITQILTAYYNCVESQSF